MSKSTRIALVWVIHTSFEPTVPVIPFATAVTSLDLNAMFSNATELKKLHEEFFTLVSKARGNLSEVSNVFRTHAPFFRLYLEYSGNYQNALTNVTRGRKDALFEKELSRLEKSISLNFGAYLIKPVQAFLAINDLCDV